MVFEGEINVKCMVGRVISVKRNTLQSFIWGHNHLCGFHNHINSQSCRSDERSHSKPSVETVSNFLASDG